MNNEDIKKFIDSVKKNYLSWFLFLLLWIIGNQLMPAEEQHYLQSEIDRLTEERFWLLLEIMVLAALFYEIVTYQKEKLNIKRLGIKLIGQGLLIWYAYSTVNKIWNVVELYYNRQEVKKYEHIEVRLNNHNFHTPDHYFSDATVEEYTSFRVLCLTL